MSSFKVSLLLAFLLLLPYALAQTSVLPPPLTYTSGVFINPDTAATQIFGVGAVLNVTWETTYSSINLWLIYGTDYNAPYLCISGTTQTWWLWDPIDDHGHNSLPFSFRAVNAGGSADEQKSDGFYTGQFWLQEEAVVAATTAAPTTASPTPTPTPTPIPATVTIVQSQSAATTTPPTTPTTASSTPAATSSTPATSSGMSTATSSATSTASSVAVASSVATSAAESSSASTTVATTDPAAASSTSPPTPGATPTLAIGLGVGLGVAILLVAILGFFFLRRRRRHPAQSAPPSYMPELAANEKPSGYATPSWIAELHNRRSGHTLTKSPLEASSMTSPRELYGDSPSAHSRGASPVYGAGTR
ncbi:hypothetical protein B0A48_13520 [Cryoendolithus antarcticus]|uniref:Mid2 domain-containing protein n=1 Tax=Cryoendolithus antarcticus TaxID=1507870 RepID=A0A1V8SNV7_9PEZI|nr:hypothetical protein B0A48_13520 [Cryoendolithus antarcticus]